MCIMDEYVSRVTGSVLDELSPCKIYLYSIYFWMNYLRRRFVSMYIFGINYRYDGIIFMYTVLQMKYSL